MLSCWPSTAAPTSANASRRSQRVGDGGVDDWHREWVATADRIAAIGDESAAGGHRASAREAYYRACNYYRSSYFPLYGAPTDPRLVEAFDKETAVFLKGAALSDIPIEADRDPLRGQDPARLFRHRR